MMTDALSSLRDAFKELTCHHEYIHKHAILYCFDYYECRKCGRLVYNPPKKLVVKNDGTKQN